MAGGYSALSSQDWSRSRMAAVRPPWSRLHVVESTGSTNADLLREADHGAIEGQVLVALHQTAGRGRLDRSWVSAAAGSLTFSVLLRPHRSVSEWAWLSLLTGLAVADAVHTETRVDARVKWPNDVLIDGRKVAGILAEGAADASHLVLGVGMNNGSHPVGVDALDEGTVTSLAAQGATISRDHLLASILDALGVRYEQWRARGAAGIESDYRDRCSTIGSAVRVTLPGGLQVQGTAHGVDEVGRLLVTSFDGGELTLAAGDVVHLR